MNSRGYGLFRHIKTFILTAQIRQHQENEGEALQKYAGLHELVVVLFVEVPALEHSDNPHDQHAENGGGGQKHEDHEGIVHGSGLFLRRLWLFGCRGAAGHEVIHGDVGVREGERVPQRVINQAAEVRGLESDGAGVAGEF